MYTTFMVMAKQAQCHAHDTTAARASPARHADGTNVPAGVVGQGTAVPEPTEER